MEIIHLTDIPSTNDYLLGLHTEQDVVAVSDYQSHGKGMGNNRWESEAGKNLLFSILLHPINGNEPSCYPTDNAYPLYQQFQTKDPSDNCYQFQKLKYL